MTKKVAVVLSGCGVYDGSEVYESVLTLLRLDQLNTEVTCFAPDIQQLHVINHLTGEVSVGEERNVLAEAARMVRGEVHSVNEARADAFDALIVPGGFGAAKNLCDYAVQGAELTVTPTFLSFAQSMHQASKPIGLICIAPAMSAAICGTGVECTIGNDDETVSSIEATGAQHKVCPVDDIHIDKDKKLVTTPAYMLAGRITEAATGINKLVDAVVEMA